MKVSEDGDRVEVDVFARSSRKKVVAEVAVVADVEAVR